jgi:putative CocE/NonD family hydrolase
MLVMGPWYHGGWARSKGRVLGKVDFGVDTAVFYRREIEFPFFKHFLKGEGDLNLPEAYVFQTGKNLWREEDEWPPAKAEKKALYLCSDWKLDWAPDAEHSADAFDEYVSDPGKPVPYTNEISMGMTREHMIDDQRFAARRSDVLTYATEVLKSDITIGGPVLVNLNVSTTGTDADFVVKLIDVYPDRARLSGFQQLVRGEAFRGKFRNSYSEPEPFVPGSITPIKYQMPDILHTFRKGHRIMIQIQSSWFPLVDLNPQKFTDIYHAKESDFITATHRVYRSGSFSSFITLNKID